MSFDNIPAELRQLKQWVNWHYVTIREIDKDGKPSSRITKVPLQSRNGQNASVTDPRDWSTFEIAVANAVQCNGIGFVFTADDPFCGCDLDNIKEAEPLRANATSDVRKSGDVLARIQRQRNIYERLNSYSEWSPSGEGIHIIAKANLPGKGRRRDKVELYDTGRFFTFTGNTCNNVAIATRQAEVVEIWQSLGGVETVETFTLGYDPETLTDEEIIERAANAANGEKFKRLYSGDWQTDYGNRSQSEADFALINILAFYSRNNPQITRIFRVSGLGKREKAQRGSYVSLMVRRAFDRVPPTVTATPTGDAPWFDATLYEPWDKPTPLHLTGPYVPPVPTEPTVSLPATPSSLPAIPGLVGDLMRHCWNSATYQIPEVAIASAITSMAVLASRTYRYGSTGLAMYLLLIAKTSVGKSFAYQAQNAWVNALRKRFDNPTGGAQYKARLEFLEGLVTGKFASGPGIASHILRNPCTLSQYDEFVVTMKRINAPLANANDTGIKEELLSLVDASHPGAIYREKRYSDRTAKTKPIAVQSACLNMLATGTPADFYNDMGESILEGGFLPRFTMIEYDGTLPEKNRNVIRDIDREVMNQITNHFNQLFELSQVITGDINQIKNVEADPQAAIMLAQWETYCEGQVRLAHRESAPTAGIWSRAQLHVTQIAALIAIGCSAYQPTITGEHVTLALQIVQPGLEKLTGRVSRSEIGSNDARGAAEVRQFVKRVKYEGIEFCKACPSLNREVFQNGYIQASVAKWYLSKRSPFTNHKLGTVRAFDDCIASMIRDGELERKDYLCSYARRKLSVLSYCGAAL